MPRKKSTEPRPSKQQVAYARAETIEAKAAAVVAKSERRVGRSAQMRALERDKRTLVKAEEARRKAYAVLVTSNPTVLNPPPSVDVQDEPSP